MSIYYLTENWIIFHVPLATDNYQNAKVITERLQMIGVKILYLNKELNFIL